MNCTFTNHALEQIILQYHCRYLFVSVYTGMILIDLQKAFGTLDHKILIENEMVEFLSHKQTSFRFSRQCIFGSRDHQL